MTGILSRFIRIPYIMKCVIDSPLIKHSAVLYVVNQQPKFTIVIKKNHPIHRRLFVSASSIKCYSCSSNTNEACKYPVQSKLSVVHCDLNAVDQTKNHAATVDRAFTDIFEVAIGSQDPKLPMGCLKQVTMGNLLFRSRTCLIQVVGLRANHVLMMKFLNMMR